VILFAVAPSTFDPQTFDIGIVLTAAGVPVASGIIAAFVQVLKGLPGIGAIIEAGNETPLVTILAGILVIYAYAAIGVPLTLTSGFLAFLAWINLVGFAGKAYDVAPDGLKSALVLGKT